MDPAILVLAGLFYLLLLTGAVIRFLKARSLPHVLQLCGTVFPLIPAALMAFNGVSSNLLIAYCVLWLPMAIGYVVEGIGENRTDRFQLKS